jgi:uncharacterized protein YceK
MRLHYFLANGEVSMRKKIFRSLIVLVLLSLLSITACATYVTQVVYDREKERGKPSGDEFPCPPYIYSGVIIDLMCITDYGCNNGKCGVFVRGTNNIEFFCLLDLPLSAVMDTAILPITIYRQIKYGNMCNKYEDVAVPQSTESTSERQVKESQ